MSDNNSDDTVYAPLKKGMAGLTFEIGENGGLRIAVFTNIPEADMEENYLPGLMSALAHIVVNEQDFVLDVFHQIGELGTEILAGTDDDLKEADLALIEVKGNA